MRERILKMCNQRKDRKEIQGVLADITGGQVWTDFLFVNGRAFLDVLNNLVFMLNIDWFNLYEHSQYSVGVIYLVLLNQQRSERYKLENVLNVGCLPAPREPKHNINTYLEFMVVELCQLWAGINFTIPSSSVPVHIRAAMICISYDIPACRKVCEFTGFLAKLGCSKCLSISKCSFW